MTLPPWKAHDAHDRQAMIDFVVHELKGEDARDAAHPRHDWDGTLAPEVAFQAALTRAKASARLGDIGPLRRFLARIDPELVDFVSEPRRVRGQRRTGQRDVLADFMARDFADDVERVRQIWRKNYDGRWKRHSADGPSAEEIVAVYHSK
jgi:hypothetical protein